jgi:hypothetical protein
VGVDFTLHGAPRQIKVQFFVCVLAPARLKTILAQTMAKAAD